MLEHDHQQHVGILRNVVHCTCSTWQQSMAPAPRLLGKPSATCSRPSLGSVGSTWDRVGSIPGCPPGSIRSPSGVDSQSVVDQGSAGDRRVATRDRYGIDRDRSGVEQGSTTDRPGLDSQSAVDLGSTGDRSDSTRDRTGVGQGLIRPDRRWIDRVSTRGRAAVGGRSTLDRGPIGVDLGTIRIDPQSSPDRIDHVSTTDCRSTPDRPRIDTVPNRWSNTGPFRIDSR